MLRASQDHRDRHPERRDDHQQHQRACPGVWIGPHDWPFIFSRLVGLGTDLRCSRGTSWVSRRTSTCNEWTCASLTRNWRSRSRTVGGLSSGQRTVQRTVRFALVDLHRGAPEIAGFRGNVVHLDARVLAARDAPR